MPSIASTSTLLSAYSLVSGLVALCMLLVSRSRTVYPGFNHWTVASACAFVGVALLSLRSALPPVIAQTAATAGIVAYYALLYAGLAIYLELRILWWPHLVAAALLAGPYSYFTYALPDANAQNALFSLIAGGYCLGMLAMTRFSWARYGKNWILGGGVAFMAAFFLLRSIYAVSLSRLVTDPATHAFLQGLPFLVAILGSVTIPFGLMTLNSQRTEKSLKENEGLFRSIFDLAPDAMLIGGYDGRFLEANSRACELFGFTRDQLLSLDVSAIGGMVLLDGPGARSRFPERGYLETTRRRSDGSEVRVELAVRGISYKGSPAMLGIARDLTERLRSQEEREQLQEQLQQAQKMEAVGRLAGGIAHDFNNLLTVISGYGDLSLEEAPRDSALRSHLEQVRWAVRRATTLTAQLLTFSRKQVLQPRVFDPGQLIGAMEEMLRRLLGEDVEVRTEQGPGLWNVRADPARIEQVIMNLAVNSRDAMPHGGRLRIATLNCHVDPDSSRVRPPMKAGDYVLLSVSDTGHGMDAATMSRIFEPFFTTKEQGKGTGLGLATAYGIVKQSEGYIFCASEKGKGTTFDIYLPRSLDPHEERDLQTPPVAEPGRRTETILLSEDDEGVRRLMISLLARAGYSVVPAGSGAEALAALDELPGGIALLITDVLMPGLNGREVARRVRARHPGVKVMFVSGYTADENVRQAAGEDGVDFLQKPFKSADLLARVRRLLDTAPGADPEGIRA